MQRLLGIVLGAVSLTVLASSALAEDVTAPVALKAPDAPSTAFIYGVIVVVFVAALVSILLIRSAVAISKFSLAEALSEESEVTFMTKDANGNETPLLNPAGEPVMVTVMASSSSRLIALMGLVGLLLMFIGFGVFALYYFAMTQQMPAGVDGVVKFLVGGLTLFAPYMVNKFAGVFESLSPKPKK